MAQQLSHSSSGLSAMDFTGLIRSFFDELSLIDELQRYYCLDEQYRLAFDTSTLSQYAYYFVARHREAPLWNDYYIPLSQYLALSGVSHQPQRARLALTSNQSTVEAVQREIAAFKAFLRSYRHMSIAEAERDPFLGVQPSLRRFAEAREDDEYIIQDTDGCVNLYAVYRVHSSAPPISYPAMLEVSRLAAAIVEDVEKLRDKEVELNRLVVD